MCNLKELMPCYNDPSINYDQDFEHEVIKVLDDGDEIRVFRGTFDDCVDWFIIRELIEFESGYYISDPIAI